MAKDKKEIGKSIFERALAKLPKEKQDKLQELLSEDTVLETIGEHGLMREDYSRLADEAKAEQAQAQAVYNANLTWREQKAIEIERGKEAIGALERMKAAGLKLDDPSGSGTPAAPATPAPASSGLTKEEIEKMLRGTESQGLQVMGALNDIAISHYAEFGEKIKTSEIIAAAQKQGVDLNTAYDTMVADRRAERQKKELAKQLEEAEKRGAEKERARQSAAPYPIGSMDAGGVPSTLAGLTKDSAKRAEFGVDAAVRRLNENRRSTN